MNPHLRLALALVDRAESLPSDARVRRVLLGLLAVALACAVLVVPVDASAQADHEIAARICWSESGPRAHAECAAIVHVLVERASMLGRGFASMARAYAPRATGTVAGHRRPFVPLLSIDVERAPLGWPHHGMRYSEGRTLLSALAATAWRALRGIDETPCPGAEHWGARGCGACRRRMRAAGLRRIQCRAETANTFWGW